MRESKTAPTAQLHRALNSCIKHMGNFHGGGDGVGAGVGVGTELAPYRYVSVSAFLLHLVGPKVVSTTSVGRLIATIRAASWCCDVITCCSLASLVTFAQCRRRAQPNPRAGDHSMFRTFWVVSFSLASAPKPGKEIRFPS